MADSALSTQRARRPLGRLLHRAYKLTLSPFIGRSCRFEPTCSDYGLEAVERYGWLRGSFMALRRILRCNPWCAGGHDPVP
jgi:putative membrane protein insertion efficiency factor